MGHVPARPVRVVGPGGHLQGRQHRGAPGEGDLLTPTPPGRAGHARRSALGRSGEDRAAAWYASRGYQVVERNWRSRQGELDLVLRQGRTLVFSEVKARSGDRFGEPFEAVTPSKQARLRRLAAEWLRDRGESLRGEPFEVRFVVVSVRYGQVEVLEGAF